MDAGREARAHARVNALDPTLRPVHMQPPVPEIDLRPAKLAELLRLEPMPVRQQYCCAIACAIAPSLTCSLDQSLNLFLSEILPCPIGRIGQAEVFGLLWLVLFRSSLISPASALFPLD